MHKLIAIAIVMILAFNVAASEQGGFNEETSVEGTDIITRHLLESRLELM